MASFFLAAKAVKVFTEYRQLTLAYWSAQPSPYEHGWMAGDLPEPENEKSLEIRQKIIRLYPVASVCAGDLGVPVTGTSFPAPAIGGPIIPVNLLYGAFNRKQGHGILPQQEVLDGIDRCLAKAHADKKHLLWRQLLNPIWWAIELIAYVLRIPFMILRRAGVPASVEESIWGNTVKVCFFFLIVLLGLHYGLKLEPKDVLSWLK